MSRSRPRGGGRWSARLSPPAPAGGGCGPRRGRSRAPCLSPASAARPRRRGLPCRGVGGAAVRSPCGALPAAAGRCGVCRCRCVCRPDRPPWPLPCPRRYPRRCGWRAASGRPALPARRRGGSRPAPAAAGGLRALGPGRARTRRGRVLARGRVLRRRGCGGARLRPWRLGRGPPRRAGAVRMGAGTA